MNAYKDEEKETTFMFDKIKNMRFYLFKFFFISRLASKIQTYAIMILKKAKNKMTEICGVYDYKIIQKILFKIILIIR